MAGLRRDVECGQAPIFVVVDVNYVAPILLTVFANIRIVSGLKTVLRTVDVQ